MHLFSAEGGSASDFLFDAVEKKEYAEYIPGKYPIHPIAHRSFLS